MTQGGGLTLFCDPGVNVALRGVARAGGWKVAVLSAPPASMRAQLVRHTHNDVLFTLSTEMDQAVAAGLVNAATRRDGLKVPYVLAARSNAMPAPPQRVAVTDDTAACQLDGRALLAANNIAPANVIGTATTADAADMVRRGAADLALITQTQCRADPDLALFKVLAAPNDLISYAVAVNMHAYSPDAGPFCDWLLSDAARPVLIAAGFA